MWLLRRLGQEVGRKRVRRLMAIWACGRSTRSRARVCPIRSIGNIRKPCFILEQRQIRISMDGRGRWLDNVFIERLWRPLKYECVYLYAFATGSELRAGLAIWIVRYNG